MSVISAMTEAGILGLGRGPIGFTSTGNTVGSVVTVTKSFGWDYSAIQWTRTPTAGGATTDIAGATGASYVLTSADIGYTVTPRVTGLAFRLPYGVSVPVPSGAPTVVASPTINSAPKVFEVLDATAGSFSGASSVTTNVYANGVMVGTLPYVVMPSDLNKSLTLDSVGTNASGSTHSLTDSSTNCLPVLSASKRTVLPYMALTAGANNVRSSRLADRSNKTVTDPWVEWWNGYVDAATSNAPQEKGVGNVVPIRAALLLNTSGSGQNQSSAVLVQLKWTRAAACQAGYIFKLDGTQPTTAEFSAAGGAISGDGYTLTVPDGWRVRSDRAYGFTILKDAWYMVSWEIAPAVGAKYPSQPVSSGRTDLGDMMKDQAGAGTAVFLKDWTTLSGVTAGQVVCGPCNVYGSGAYGEKSLINHGDSIGRENSDRITPNGALYGDADGCTAFVNRALNIGKYSWTRAAVSGTNATVPALYGGFSQRLLQGQFADAAITNMGNNNRSLPWSGPVGTGLLATQRDHWAKIRAAARSSSLPLIAVTFAPQASSTDSWATTANQTSLMGPGTPGYDSYNPYLRAGVFTAADPMAAYDMYNAIYAGAGAAGFTDVVDGKIPCNGTAQAGYFDSTHPQAAIHTYVAADLASKLPTLLGF